MGSRGRVWKGGSRRCDGCWKPNPDHLSAYGLQVEESTYYHRSGVQADDDLQADMYEAAADILESAGYVHYEISNFARPGFECRHNFAIGVTRNVWGPGFLRLGMTALNATRTRTI
jgi:coproporphyrinogen III oxidase-like Fe-S oxidoreductase